MSKPFLFEDNVFEIALVTYNRPEFVQVWFDKCYSSACERNISVSVYDSSPNDDTLRVVELINDRNAKRINYFRIDSNIHIGYKPMYPILQSQSKYVWVSGDSRYHDFDELDKKVFPYLNQGIDYVTMQILDGSNDEAKVYDDLGDFIHECFIPSTCIGLSIYKTDLFSELKLDLKKMEYYDNLFKENYAFAWLGYFYSIYAQNGHKAVCAKVHISNILSDKKIQTWAKRFYACWLVDLCQIIDNIPNCYSRKGDIPRETWQKMKLDSHLYCYRARKKGDLNAKSYEYYKENALLDRVVDCDKRIKFYAKAPMVVIEIVYKAYQFFSLMKG